MADIKNLFSLKGKSALVTGATGILGQSFCRALAANGANVAVVDLKLEDVSKLSKELAGEFGVSSMGLVCDVSDPKSVAEMTKKAVKDLGGIHILHNNAATKTGNLGDFFASTESYSLQTWNEIMSVNLGGMFLVAQAVGKHMVESGRGGSIIQTASIYGCVGPDQRIYEGSHYMGIEINTPAVYSASKAGVIGLTKYLATLWGAKGVRVNTLTPGGVQSGQNETFISKYSSRVPLGRMAEPQEMLGALVFLASDASSYVTGQNLIVDGGLSAW